MDDSGTGCAVAILMGVFIAALFAVVVFLQTIVVKWAWNALVPAVFHGPHITFWQAFGLIILLDFISGVFKKAS